MATREIYEFGGFRLDPAGRSLQTKGGEPVAIRAKAFEALVYLVEHAGEPVARRTLTEALWPGTVVEENNLTQAISALRRKLGKRHIVTLPGRGYQFVTEVRSLAHGTDREASVSAAQQPRSARLDADRPLASGSEDVEAATRIAVLPFENQSADPEESRFSDGLTDELIVSLQRLPALRVTGRTTAFAFRDSRMRLQEITGELGIDYVVEGSVAREGDRLRVRVQLSDAAGFGVWPYSYDGALESLFDVQTEIVRGIAEGLCATLGIDQALRVAGTDSIEAYELYVVAREKVVQGVIDSHEGGVLISRAVELDPQFAQAWGSKALMHSAQLPLIVSTAERRRTLAAADEAVSRAIELAPDLVDGYAARGYVEAERGNWSSAQRAYEQARSVGRVPEDRSAYGHFLIATGRLAQALEHFERELETDHLRPFPLLEQMVIHEQLGDREAADRAHRRYEILYGTDGWGAVWRSWVLLGRGDVGAIVESYWSAGLGAMSLSAEVLEDREQALERFHETAVDPVYGTPAAKATLAMWMAHFGDLRGALHQLKQSVDGAALYMHVAWLPVFEAVRRLPGFKELLIDIGLVDFWHAHGWPDVCEPTRGEDFSCV